MIQNITPEVIKKMTISELNTLAGEIRERIIEVTSKNGGHLASNLGVVELTLALHYVFDSPHDKLIFDVSHQTYTHKIITGRNEQFDSLRKEDGLSGFSKMSESEHDVFEAGHSSTSISSGIGFLEAKKAGKDIGEVVAVVGDASIVNGLCFEAINYLGAHSEEKMIIIVNDNNMSVSKNVGALAKRYNKIRLNRGFKLLKKIVPIRIKHALQYYAYKVDTFTSFGFKYFENIDGHNIEELIKYLNYAKNYNKSIVLHVKTQKGKGYQPAEDDKIGFYHGLGPFNIENGKLKKEPTGLTYGEHICSKLIELSKKEDGNNIRVLCPAMVLGCGIIKFQEEFPERLIDVGIAEENAAVIASSLSINGIVPVLFVYSTFVQRAYDEILHDIARINAHVIFCIDHAGIVSGDGNTHQGIYDMAMFNSIPGLTIMQPTTGLDAEKMIEYAVKELNGPVVIRYPKGSAPSLNTYFNNSLSWMKIKEGKDYIVSYGPIIENIHSRINEEKIDVGLINALTTTPLDEEMLKSLDNSTLYVYEEVINSGNLASNILNYISENDLNIKIKSISIKSGYIDEGSNDEIRKRHHVSLDDLFSIIK